ncbi:MAG TPA: serine dehydratase beta chain [archaeon]|nr:serine dehydratase beta chain [archaeon]
MDSRGKKLSVFDVIGPIMVGPSSSHTAGAQRIGFALHKKLRGRLKAIEVTLYNSFADTGEGHGTKTAIIAGILGLEAHDESLKKSLEIARAFGVKVSFRKMHDDSKHPNSAFISAETDCGNFCGFGESLGGGMVDFRELELEVASRERNP